MNKSVNSNEELSMLEALKAGKRQAFEDLYREYYKMIFKLITTNNGSSDDAQDIFQESLIVLVKNLRKEDFELKAKLGTYLYSIARNLWLYRLRGTKNIHNIALEDAGAQHLALDEEEIVRKRVNEKRYEVMADKLAELKADCRKIIVESFKKGRALKELAAEMGYTDAFIRVKKNRCMNEYRKRVQAAIA